MSSKNILAALSDTNNGITLGLTLAGQLTPLIKGLFRGIRLIGAGTDTATYEVVIHVDAAELDTIAALSLEDLAAVNAELAKLGKAPVIPIDSGSSVSTSALPAAQVPDPAVSAAPAQAGAATPGASSDAASGSAPAPAGAVTEVPAGGNSAAPLEFRGTHWSPPADPAAADVPATDASSAPEVKAS